MRKRKIISISEVKRRLLAAIPNKTRVSQSAIRATEKAAEEEIECIILENTNREGKTIL